MVKNNYKWGWGAKCPYCHKVKNYKDERMAKIVERSGCNDCFMKELGIVRFSIDDKTT